MRRTKKKGPFFLFPFFFSGGGGIPPPHILPCLHLPPSSSYSANNSTNGPFSSSSSGHISPSIAFLPPRNWESEPRPFFSGGGGRDRCWEGQTKTKLLLSHFWKWERETRAASETSSDCLGGRLNCFYEFFRLPSINVHLPNFRAIFFSLTFSGPIGIRNL